MTCFIHKLPSTEAPWAYAIEFDFNQAMVDAIKTKIPSRARSWKPERRQWWFRDDVMDMVLALAMLHSGRYVHVESLETEPPVQSYAALHLLPTAPPEVVSAAYKALAKKVHPDAGGSQERMQAINSAYALIKRDYA